MDIKPSGPRPADRPSGCWFALVDDREKLPGGSGRSGCNFSQPRLTTGDLTRRKFGLRLILRSVRCGISAPTASMAHAASHAASPDPLTSST